MFDDNGFEKHHTGFGEQMKTVTITQKVVVPASPNEVYEAFLDPRSIRHLQVMKQLVTQRLEGSLLQGMVLF